MQQKITLTTALAVLWLAGLALPLSAGEVPKRKPGLWEITTVGAGTGTNTAQTCIGEDDKILTPAGSGDCLEPKVSFGGTDTTIVDVVCTRDGSKETISAAFTGDFSSRYQAQVKMSFDPPPPGLPPHIGVTIAGKYLGPDCEAAKTPGAPR